MYSELKVCYSAAGYYIGRMWIEDDFEEPGTRESEYYPTFGDAQAALLDGFTLRMCTENEHAFNAGLIDTQPGTPFKL